MTAVYAPQPVWPACSMVMGPHTVRESSMTAVLPDQDIC